MKAINPHPARMDDNIMHGFQMAHLGESVTIIVQGNWHKDYVQRQAKRRGLHKKVTVITQKEHKKLEKE